MDISKIERELGWRPSRELRDGPCERPSPGSSKTNPGGGRCYERYGRERLGVLERRDGETMTRCGCLFFGSTGQVGSELRAREMGAGHAS